MNENLMKPNEKFFLFATRLSLVNGGGCEKENFVLSTTGVFSVLVVVLVMVFFSRSAVAGLA